jgi:hypothetical protein
VRCGSLAVAGARPSLTRGHLRCHRPPRTFASCARSFGGTDALGSAQTSSLVSISLRARESALLVPGRDRRSRDSSPCFLSAWTPVSLLSRRSSTALAAKVSPHAACAAYRGRASDRVPARSDRCVPRTTFTRARARRARPPPFAPRGAASPVTPRGVASPSRAGGISREMLPSHSPDLRGFEDDASGRPACFSLELPSSRGAELGGDPGPFDRCLLLTDSVFRDDSSSLDTRCIAFPTRYRSLRFTPRWPASASRPTSRSVFFSGLRPVGVPLMPRRPAGFPGGAASTGVGPRSRKRPRVEPDGLDRPLPSRVNGLRHRLDPRHLHRLFAFRASQRPGLRAPSTSVPFQNGTRADRR